MTQKKSGYVAIVGRPNVGKSTLLNHLIGQKLSITSRKPQTTRHQVIGVETRDSTQIIYVDTPGLHLKEAKAINRYMNRAASSALSDIDVVIFVIDAQQWQDDDEHVLAKVKNVKKPVILAVNKIDRLKEKNLLLPILEQLGKKMDFTEVVPLSALRNTNLPQLHELIERYLPEGDFILPEDYLTDRSERFLAAEIIREKIMRRLGDELPYSITVEIERFEINERGVAEVNGLIYVERNGQKRILIGKQGSKLKLIGRDAREDMEKLFDRKVYLKLWVKIKDGWADDERALRSLGYGDN